MTLSFNKHSEYAARSIPEYWIVDPRQARVTILTLVDGLYEETVFEGEDKLVSSMLSGVRLSADQILKKE